MASNSTKAKCSSAYANVEPSSVRNHFEGVETRRRPPKCSHAYGEGIVRGVAKAAQTRILWSLVQVQHALPLTQMPPSGVAFLFQHIANMEQLLPALQVLRKAVDDTERDTAIDVASGSPRQGFVKRIQHCCQSNFSLHSASMKKLFWVTVFILGLTGCLATGPKQPVAVQPGLTQTNNLIDGSGFELPVRIAARFGDDRPKATVLIGHGSAGVTPTEYEQARHVASWGYNAVVVDHYTARGIKRHTGRRISGGLPDDRAADMIAVARWVKQQPWHQGKMALIGISQGGAGLWALANEKNMRSHGAIQVTDEDLKLITVGVAMYPACAPDLASPPREPLFPVQLHIGEADDLALPRWCETFGNPKYEKHTYPGATHSFNYAGFIPNNTRFTHRYDNDADKLSQSRIKVFLEKHLKN